MWSNLRHALRVLAKSPASSLTILLTLMVAIGANSAIFSVVDAVLFKPLPYPGSERLVTIFETNLAAKAAESLVAPARVEDWSRLCRSLDSIAGHYFENLTDTTGTLPERVSAMRVSPGFFQVMGTPPAIGRTFNPDEERFGGPNAVVLSDAFWRTRFQADPAVAGRTMRLGDKLHTIIGVMPPSFRYPEATTAMWLGTKLHPNLLAARQARFYNVVGRVKEGVDIRQAQADLAAVQARLGEQYPKFDRGWSVAVQPLKEQRVGGVRRSLLLLFGAVGFVLLIACANIACLLLARGAAREREIAIRFALGAKRGVIIGQLLREGLLLAIVGAALGFVLSRWGVDAIRLLAPNLPRLEELHADWRILTFTLALGITTTMLFALIPALQATRPVTYGNRSQIGGRQRLQKVLVVTQIALAVVLLVGSGLLIRSFARLQQVSPGFDPGHVLTFRISAQWTEEPAQVALRHSRTIEKLAAIPGVEAAAVTTVLPASASFAPSEFRIPGDGSPENDFAEFRQVSRDYFRTLRIPILQGATCQLDYDPSARAVVLVNRKFADRYFPGRNPVGRQIEQIFASTILPSEIIGVVGDVRENSLQKDPPPLVYPCGVKYQWPDPRYLVRVAGQPLAALNAIRETVRGISAARAVYSPAPLEDVLSTTLAEPRLNTTLLGLFAAMALLLAALGLYGVMSYFVTQRTREIGLRMAIGALPSQVLGRVLRQGLLLIVTGAIAGLLGAFVLSRWIASLLFGVSDSDALSFAGAPLILLVVALAACCIPALRATRIDPIEALRAE